MSDVVVVAEMSLVEGREEEAPVALGVLCTETHAKEDGCRLYALHRVMGDPTRVVMIERWDSMDALKSHAVAAHIEEFKALTCLAPGAKINLVEPTGHGDAEKGML